MSYHCWDFEKAQLDPSKKPFCILQTYSLTITLTACWWWWAKSASYHDPPALPPEQSWTLWVAPPLTWTYWWGSSSPHPIGSPCGWSHGRYHSPGRWNSPGLRCIKHCRNSKLPRIKMQIKDGSFHNNRLINIYKPSPRLKYTPVHIDTPVFFCYFLTFILLTRLFHHSYITCE